MNSKTSVGEGAAGHHTWEKKNHFRHSDIFLASTSAILSERPMSMQVIRKKNIHTRCLSKKCISNKSILSQKKGKTSL